jgi:hypothetical protein
MTNVVKSAAFTFLQSWVGTFLLALTGWLQDLLSWVSDLGDGGEAVVAFPDPNVLIKLVASGAVSLVIAVVTALHTYARNRGVLGEPPAYSGTTTS